MLAQRRRGGGHGGGGGVGAGGGANRILATGHNAGGSLGGGYSLDGAFNFFQPAIVVTQAQQVALASNSSLALCTGGRVFAWGQNANFGNGGFGERNVAREIPKQLVGGLPLYTAETLGPKAGKTFNQPVGPVGPLLGKIAAVAGAGLSHHILTAADATRTVNPSGGRVLAWGNNNQGQLGNGWEQAGEDPQSGWESGKWRPQYAPWWVQTGGPPQSEAVGGTNILQNVLAIAQGSGAAFFLVKNGAAVEVWYCGALAGLPGTERAYYAQRDPLGVFVGPQPVAIAASRSSYMVLLSDGTVRVVGINGEGMWGEGLGAEETVSTRGIGAPMIAPGEPLHSIVAIAKGEYHCKALDNIGNVWTWGSNEEGQQGLGTALEVPILRPTKIPGLTGVLAIDADGEVRGNGEFGGDVAVALMTDRTIRTWGKNFDPGALRVEKGEVVGTLGDNTALDKSTPTTPQLGGVAIGNVVALATGAESMAVVQEPGVPLNPPSVSATSPSTGQIVVSWVPVAGTLGVLPTWRAEEEWEVKYNDGVTGGKTAKLSAATRSFSASVTAGSTVVIKVIGVSRTEEPAVSGGAVKTAAAGKLAIAWSAPAKAEPGWIVEYRRLEPYLARPTATSLASGLSTGAPVTSLPVKKLTKPLASGILVVLEAESHRQVFTLNAAAAVGATALSVVSQTPSFAFPTKAVIGVACKLASGLSTAGPITSIAVDSVPAKMLNGDLVTIESGAQRQMFEASAQVAVGAKSIPVHSLTPIFAFPAGSAVAAVEQEKWQRPPVEVPGGTLSYLLTLTPSNQGIQGEQVEVRVSGSFEGSYKTRVVSVSAL